MTNRLMAFLRANGKTGGFRADGNTLFLYDVIVSSKADAEWFGGFSAEAFAETISKLSGPITLRINSPGGDVFAGLAIAQLIRDYKDGVTVKVDGVAASAASIVAIAAKSVLMAPAAMMMIHKAWTIALGNADDFLSMAATLDKIDGQLAGAYAGRSKESAAKFGDLMAQETWLTAQEAIDLGLADSIAGETTDGKDDKSASAKAAWDFSAFLKPPAASVAVALPGEASAQASADTSSEASAQSDIERRRRVLAVRLLSPAA